MFENLPMGQLTDADESEIEMAMGPVGAADAKKDKKEETSTKKNPPASSKSDAKKAADLAPADEDKELDTAFAAEEEDDDKDDEEEKIEGVENEDDKDDEEDDDKDTKDDDDDDKDKDDDKDEPIQVSDFLKARVELLLKKNSWKPFEYEGKKPEDVEWTEELFEEIETQQQAWKQEELKEEILTSFGPYGRDIAEYTANGGNPDDLLDLFKEEQRVLLTDITTEEGQRKMVYDYFTNVLGRSPEKVTKDIERFIADKDLESEAQEAQKKILEFNKKEAETLKLEQEQREVARKQSIKNNQLKFKNEVTAFVSQADDIPDDEKQQIIKVLTKFDKKTEAGGEVNEFYFKFAEFKKDLPNYLKLVRLVLNPDKYIKTIEGQGKNKTADKAFNLVRKNNMSKKVKTNSQTPASGGSKKSGFTLTP